MILFLAFLMTTLAVRQHPVSPAVGDPVTLEYKLAPGQKIVLRPSTEFEIVSSAAGSVVLRSFRTGSFSPEGTVYGPGGHAERLRGPQVTIHSVLAKDDALKPAPLHPPLPLPRDRTAEMALAIAAVVAVALWAAVVYLARRRSVALQAGKLLAPDDEFLQALRALRSTEDNPLLLIGVADASRRYLSRVDERLGRELTTFELTKEAAAVLPNESVRVLQRILTEADIAKFSPWGSRLRSFRQFVDDASAILIPHEEEPAA